MALEKGERSNGAYGRHGGAASGAKELVGRGSRTTLCLNRSGSCVLYEWCCYVLDLAEPWSSAESRLGTLSGLSPSFNPGKPAASVQSPAVREPSPTKPYRRVAT
jgi:hypothetical protein